MRVISFLAFIMLVMPQGAFALPSSAHCAPTPALKAENYPGPSAIATGNNLLQAAGKPEEVSGVQKLILHGTVRDAACMPVSDVWVEIWQLDPFGRWMRATDEDLVTPDPVFLGTGRALTGPDGRFTFVTAFPGVPKALENKKNQPVFAPRLNLALRPMGLKPLTTVLFFDKDARNAGDPLLSKVKAEQRSLLLMQMDDRQPDALHATVTLVLPEKARYQAY